MLQRRACQPTAFSILYWEEIVFPVFARRPFNPELDKNRGAHQKHMSLQYRKGRISTTSDHKVHSSPVTPRRLAPTYISSPLLAHPTGRQPTRRTPFRPAKQAAQQSSRKTPAGFVYLRVMSTYPHRRARRPTSPRHALEVINLDLSPEMRLLPYHKVKRCGVRRLVFRMPAPQHRIHVRPGVEKHPATPRERLRRGVVKQRPADEIRLIQPVVPQ